MAGTASFNVSYLQWKYIAPLETIVMDKAPYIIRVGILRMFDTKSDIAALNSTTPMRIMCNRVNPYFLKNDICVV